MMEKPYHIARQQHLGSMLDSLQAMGQLTWRWDYGDRRATWWITETGRAERRFNTRGAEELVQRVCDEERIVWRPVPHPGGTDQLRDTEAWIAAESKRRDRRMPTVETSTE
jgi:hypothetical protein